MNHESIIRAYFQSWITKNDSVIQNYFADEIHYVESQGMAYRNKEQVLRWFNEWTGRVIEWKISSLITQEHRYACEWQFKCEFAGVITGFNGVSLITFDQENQVTVIKEFQADATLTYPFD